MDHRGERSGIAVPSELWMSFTIWLDCLDMKRGATTQTWQLQTAKNRFSEVVDKARTQGPQIVTRHGEEAAVVLGIEEYHRLIGKKAPSQSFVSCLLGAPKVPGGLRVKRERDGGRKVDLG